MARIGYARVSSVDQDLENQLAKLKSEGCEIIRSEKISGASRAGRTELATARAMSWWSPALIDLAAIRETS
jgi:DNA invertase Pin-like site-specific DNA recombinase